ncbi:MAG: hypothetical protein QG670_738, partial [Thermoproteota archaeon]|nr:hypothetical protein [Thermoproteota archaeon]
MLPLKHIAPLLAEKYHVGLGTIYDDWESRDEWAGKFLEIVDSQKMLIDVVAFINFLQGQVVYAISTADNSSARVGGIRAAIKVIRVIQDFFMIYNKEADKIKA